ncbi:MAG: PH domain-containing protein [Candidatus Doudnabacteria bacterium]
MPIFSSTNNFRGRQPDETVILLTRRHWIRLFGPLFVLALFALIPFWVYFLIAASGWYEIFSSVYWFLAAVYLFILWMIAFYNIMIYTLNTVIVTNKRVIENEQKGFFKYNLNELKLYNIQDISIKMFGILATFLNYGDIEIESAGAEQDKFYFNALPHPQKIKKVIMDLVARFHHPPNP